MDMNTPTPTRRGQNLSGYSRPSSSANLERSLLGLDDAVSGPSIIFRSNVMTTPQIASYRIPQTPHNIPRLALNESVIQGGYSATSPGSGSWMHSRKDGSSMVATPMRSVTFELNYDDTLATTPGTTVTTAALLTEEEPAMKVTASLYEDFLRALQCYPSENQFYEMLTKYEDLLMEQVISLKQLLKKALPDQEKFLRSHQFVSLLQDEANTWRLLRTLFEDRWKVEDVDPDAMLIDTLGKHLSEKETVIQLYQRDAQLRQSQLVIDWLEKNAELKLADDAYEKVEYFLSQGTAGENTLSRLQNKMPALNSMKPIVTEMDPDAPMRQKRPLDDLDKEDESRLLKHLLLCLRIGRLDEAQRLCIRFGQPWRAATLEGWRLHHDPNYDNTGQDTQPIEGNGFRDVWKAVCWRMADDEQFSLSEKALYGALSGNLKAVLPACSSWEDYLWAYYRAMVDNRVEQEIRTTIIPDHSFEPLPHNYSDKHLTPEAVFHELQANPNTIIQSQSREHFPVIQKYVILDDLNSLVEEMHDWVQNKANLPRHLMRFMAHLVLFFRLIGRSCHEELCNKILETYVKNLIEERRLPLVASYTATLNQEHQVLWYAKFLEDVTERSERQLCLELADNAGLNVPSITKLVVENIRSRSDPTPAASSGPHVADPTLDLPAETTEEDRKKIDAMDWLFFNQSQRAEALYQANALMRAFLACRKRDAARAVFAKVPRDSISIITKSWQMKSGNDILPGEEENATREYLCLDAYLTALESFNDWFEHYHNSKPLAPRLAKGAKFTERVAFEHMHKQYTADLDRWHHGLNVQTKITTSHLYNVLLFADGGWMKDRRTDEQVDEARTNQMLRLRELCLPEVTILLHSVLHSTEQYQACIQLADILAMEEYKLYEVFRKDQLKHLLSKLRDSSVALLDRNLDPLGFHIK